MPRFKDVLEGLTQIMEPPRQAFQEPAENEPMTNLYDNKAVQDAVFDMINHVSPIQRASVLLQSLYQDALYSQKLPEFFNQCLRCEPHVLRLFFRDMIQSPDKEQFFKDLIRESQTRPYTAPILCDVMNMIYRQMTTGSQKEPAYYAKFMVCFDECLKWGAFCDSLKEASTLQEIQLFRQERLEWAAPMFFVRMQKQHSLDYKINFNR